MRHLLFTHQDGTVTAIPVTDTSTVTVKTWTPPHFGDSAVGPQLVEDQTLSLAGVQSVGYSDAAPAGATVVQMERPLEGLSDAEAAALEAQYETVPLDKPWDD